MYCILHTGRFTFIATRTNLVVIFQELLRQREQLEGTEKHLDEINNTLRFSQKHITSIKVIVMSI
jgi:hypothetical protein